MGIKQALETEDFDYFDTRAICEHCGYETNELYRNMQDDENWCEDCLKQMEQT
jgi:formylmethanofuran dehydrogenase subunit E